ncbi:MAG TPA: carboxyl transferase domain-containing protein, partial [Elusimicrobiales bacterium]|nr:carboxyl transferase domain-containing protein [Elusimicrobiales bacterium]
MPDLNEDAIRTPQNSDKKVHPKKVRPVSESLVKYRNLRAQAEAGGPPEKIEAQKKRGKLTARERIAYLLDEGSFQEIGLLMESRCTDFGIKDKHIKGDGVVTGFGKVNGRPIAVFSEDFTQLGGSLGRTHADKIARIMDMAKDAGVPVVGILDSGGARIQEGVDSLDGYGEIFLRNTLSSGKIPQISVIVGPCAGGAVYSPALTDFVFMVKGISHMFVTGPEVVKAATGETVDFETLGGAFTHASKSGVCHFMANSEPDCFRQVKELLGFLPANHSVPAPAIETRDSHDRKVPLLEKLCEMDPRK